MQSLPWLAKTVLAPCLVIYIIAPSDMITFKAFWKCKLLLTPSPTIQQKCLSRTLCTRHAFHDPRPFSLAYPGSRTDHPPCIRHLWPGNQPTLPSSCLAGRQSQLQQVRLILLFCSAYEFCYQLTLSSAVLLAYHPSRYLPSLRTPALRITTSDRFPI